MKIALECRSLLLRQALEKFLKSYLCSQDEADFLIADRPIAASKPVFLIGSYEEAHLRKPFSCSQLLHHLETFAKHHFRPVSGEKKNEKMARDIRHETDRFVANLINIIRQYEDGKRGGDA